jgi:hypothetical protein
MQLEPRQLQHIPLAYFAAITNQQSFGALLLLV